MTKEERKERRKVKHELQKIVIQKHFHQHKFGATNKQLQSSAKKVADQILSGKSPGSVTKIVDKNETQPTI